MLKLALGLASMLVAGSRAKDVSFRVICMKAQQVEVLVGDSDSPFSLAATDSGIPLYTGTVPISLLGVVPYRYVVDGKPENFTRELPEAETATYNDLYGREISHRPLPPFPNPFPERGRWDRGMPTDPLFDSSYVPVVALTADATQVALLNGLSVEYVNATMTVFYAAGMDTFQNVVFALHKVQRDYNAKRAMAIGLTGTDNINGRKYFKLRDLSTEPTQIREVAYSSMLRACGVVTPNQVHIRLYVNAVPYGLFALTDYVLMKAGIPGTTRENFPATAFFNGTPPLPIVNWFEGSANFDYFGEDVAAYKGYDSRNPLSPDIKDLIPALKSLSAINGSQAGADSFAGYFDIHQLFVSMAFEYLAENWDAYWANSRNYALYFDPVTRKWFFIPQDFDYIFGQYSRGDTPASTYLIWEQGRARPTIPRATPVKTPLINNLLAVPAYRKRFEDCLIAIVQTLYNPRVLSARILAHAERLAEEIAWDLSNPRPMVGVPNRFTFSQFLKAVNGTGPVGGASMSLLEYIAARSETVAKQFSLQLAVPGAAAASNAKMLVTGTAPWNWQSGIIRWPAAMSGAFREAASLWIRFPCVLSALIVLTLL